ncbi:MAG: NADH-quinone oxidoreductase subunit C [Holosporales bacterium]|nr:NADH-quinone oxidoreductase subunit C [Holosporales bacterium]
MTRRLSLPDCQKLLGKSLGEDVSRFSIESQNLYVHVQPSVMLRCLSKLSSDTQLQFSTLTDCFSVDHLATLGLYHIYYQLHSYLIDMTVFVVTSALENDTVRSVTVLFENADWYEREIFEMSGLEFSEHPDLRPLFDAR